MKKNKKHLIKNIRPVVGKTSGRDVRLSLPSALPVDLIGGTMPVRSHKNGVTKEFSVDAEGNHTGEVKIIRETMDAFLKRIAIEDYHDAIIRHHESVGA